MLKQKEVDYKDTNVALIGTDEDKALRKSAAETEEEYKGAGQSPGIEIWRVEKLAIKRWPKRQYGHFYDGDSYIVLHTYHKDPKSPKLSWDVFFWLGKGSSQDERGVAAYKTVELDDLLDTAPVQHREVMGHESRLFLKLFPKGMHIMEGGIESGFNHVKPEEYNPRLLHVKGRKNVRVMQVKLHNSSLNEGDVFILDLGLKLIQWNGRTSHPMERRKASETAAAVRSDRNGKPSFAVLDSGDDGVESAVFWEALGGKIDVPAASGMTDEEADQMSDTRVFRLSDSSGKLKFTEESVSQSKEIKRSALDPKDVFIVDGGMEIFVWIGRGASRKEKKNAMVYAMKYMEENGRPDYLPITRVLDGAENDVFDGLFVGKPGASSSSSSRHGGSAVASGPSAAGSFLCTMKLLEVHTDKSGDFMAKTGEFYVDAAGRFGGLLTEGRFPSKGYFKMTVGDTFVAPAGAGMADLVIKSAVITADDKHQTFDATFRVMEQDPVKSDVMLEHAVSLPLKTGVTKLDAASADGKVTAKISVEIETFPQSFVQMKQLPALMGQRTQIVDEKTQHKAAVVKMPDAAPSAQPGMQAGKKTGTRFLVTVAAVGLQAEESGDRIIGADSGEFYFSINGARFPSRGEVVLNVGETFVARGMPVVYATVVDGSVDEEHPLVIQVKEKDKLKLDDTMASVTVPLKLEAFAQHKIEVLSANSKTKAHFVARVEGHDWW